MADLTALLEREASAEIESITAEARQRAAAVVAEARAEAEQILAQRRKSAEGQREAALVRARSAAALEASAVKLQAQHASLEAVFSEARGQLAALQNDQAAYGPVLERLISGAMAGLEGDEVVAVVVNPADVSVAQAAATKLGLSAPVSGDAAVEFGVVLRSGRNSAVENTLGARMSALEGELAAEVSKLLFGPLAEA